LQKLPLQPEAGEKKVLRNTNRQVSIVTANLFVHGGPSHGSIDAQLPTTPCTSCCL
jgi:hypothetical protein